MADQFKSSRAQVAHDELATPEKVQDVVEIGRAPINKIGSIILWLPLQHGSEVSVWDSFQVPPGSLEHRPAHPENNPLLFHSS